MSAYVQECAGGVEKMAVLSNDGAGEQDISLLIEVADVIELSLPLIGRVVSPGINDCPHLSTQAKPPALAGLAQILLMARNMCTPQNAAKLVFAPDHQSLVLLRQTNTVRRVLGALVLKPHCPRGFLEVVFCVVRKEEQRRGVGTRLVAMLKHHALSLGCLHLLTYADDSATGFFERLGFEIDHDAAMPINRFHWGISHYVGSQCALACHATNCQSCFACTWVQVRLCVFVLHLHLCLCTVDCANACLTPTVRRSTHLTSV